MLVGGELFDRIVERETYTEADALQAIRSILEGIAYLHQLQIVHRSVAAINRHESSAGGVALDALLCSFQGSEARECVASEQGQ